jgi:hypothetical protein
METRESEGLPLSGIAIILLLLGAFFLRETPLTGSRPGGPPVPHHDPEGAQRVPARLWQDPVGAVRRFRAARSDQKADTDPAAPVVEFGKLEIEESGDVGDFPRLAAAIERSFSEGTDVTVFGVAIFGGPTPRIGRCGCAPATPCSPPWGPSALTRKIHPTSATSASPGFRGLRHRPLSRRRDPASPASPPRRLRGPQQPAGASNQTRRNRRGAGIQAA